MTAPLTPQEPPFPPFPGGGSGPGDGPGGRQRFAAELGRGVLVAVLVTIGGIALGLLWLWLSPRIPMVSDGQAVYLKDTEGEEAIGGDGTFVLIAAALGAVSALLVFWRRRDGGVGSVLGLAVGGVLASVVGWRIGVWLGPSTDIVAHAKQVGPKVVFDGPLELRAKAALVAWSAAAMLAHLCVTSAFGPREEPRPLPSGVQWGPLPPK
ncbi:ABC transporter permease [Actinacidiphila sp. ITFR-21]|uniref:ABC transporter permease n=1 Tax=Actinacidiphila sp. ITFR-21 TaxID=3075199 RepID=UPI00288C3A9A|nr:ABC transporter permease [Streptomyces sp. ITFR-21]WNI15101.1 ABC transporter permease [Streptomyces sp. ITFR-21]